MLLVCLLRSSTLSSLLLRVGLSRQVNLWILEAGKKLLLLLKSSLARMKLHLLLGLLCHSLVMSHLLLSKIDGFITRDWVTASSRSASFSCNWWLPSKNHTDFMQLTLATVRSNALVQSSSWSRSALTPVSELLASRCLTHPSTGSWLRPIPSLNWLLHCRELIMVFNLLVCVLPSLRVKLSRYRCNWCHYIGILFWVVALILLRDLNHWSVLGSVVNFTSAAKGRIKGPSHALGNVMFLLIPFTDVIHLHVGGWGEIWLGLLSSRCSPWSYLLNSNPNFISNRWICSHRRVWLTSARSKLTSWCI